MKALGDAELAQLAKATRAIALRGDQEARGLAHLYRTELRRRRGVVPYSDNRTIDLRPLDSRDGRVRKWALW